MKYLNIVMWVIRGLAFLIVIFCVYALSTGRFNLSQLTPIIIPFVIIYFLGSSFQMLMRFRRAGRYPKESQIDDEEEEKNG